MINRRFIHCLLTSLFVLFPAVLPAQQLSSWEYWFDDDKDSKTGFAISGDERSISTDISTEGLEPGVHQLHIRVAQRGGEYAYSPISTTTFFKRPAGSGRQLEYWFDGDYKNRQSYSLDADGEVESLTFDMTSLSPGLHQVNIRVASPGQAFSAVYSAVVLKVSSGNVDKLEYWVDDNYLGKKTIDVYQGNDVMAHFIKDLDLSHLPMGVYRLNYRAYSSTGSAATAVGSVPVIVSTGTTPKVEYWIDDDFKHSKMLEGRAVSGGYHFSQDVDLNGVSAGAHRLNYRIVMADGKAKSAVSSTPFIAHSRYDGDGSDAVVTGYSVWVDDEESVFIPSITPLAEKSFSNWVDGRKLSPGNHTLHTKVWNSYGMSSEESDVFAVEETTVPSFVLTAACENGQVRLRVNSVVNDVSYHIYRVNEHGASARVYTTGQCHPSDVKYIDHPSAGSYTYYVLGIYSDADGNVLSLKSNEVGTTVTAGTPAETTKYGTINGRLTTDTHTPTSGVKVVFSDDVEVRVVNGLFRRVNVPCGPLTLTVQGDDAHEYDAKMIEVREGSNLVTLTGKLIESPTENSQTNDLAFASNLSWEPAQYLKFKVKNVTGKSWKGRLRVRIVRTNEKAEVDTDGDSQFGVGSVAPLNKEKNYDVITTDEFEVYGSPCEVEIPLTDFKPRLTDWYDFYIESLKSEEGPLKLNPPYKLVARNADIENPICRKLEKIDSDDMTDEEVAEMVANWIVYLCGKVKDLDGKLANIGKLENDIARITGSQLAGTKTYDELEKRIDDLITSGRVKQDKDMKTLSERIAMHISDAAAMDYVTIKKYRDKLSAGIKAAKSVSKFWGYAKKAVGAINEYQKIHGMDSYEKFFYCSKKVLELSKDPFSEILKTYIDIGEKIVNYALGIAQNEYAPWIPERISDFVPEKKDVERNPEMYAYNKYINFKIVIRYKSGIFPYWNETMGFAKYTNPKEVIDKVLVKVQNDKEPATATFDLIGISDGIMLKQTSLDNGGVRYNHGGTRGYLDNMEPPTRFWMEIYWKNGRVTKLPLLDTDGVNFHVSTSSPSLFTITFYSHSADGAYKNIADIIELTK